MTASNAHPANTGPDVGQSPSLTPASERILSGRLGLEMARFGTPLAIGMGLQTAFNLVDAYLIGQLEPDVASPALGAIGICDQVTALGTILSYGLTVAVGALMSHFQGRRDPVAVRRVLYQSLWLVLGLSAMFALVGLVGSRWLLSSAVGTKGEVLALGIPYLSVMMTTSSGIFLMLHFTSSLRAVGSSKTPVSLLVLANVVNLLLAIVLVYGPGPAPAIFSWGPPLARLLGLPRMGLMGAAWATAIARFATLIPLVIILIRRFGLPESWSELRPDRALLRRILTVGWPSSVQLVVRILAMLFTHALVARAFTSPGDQSATTALGIVFRLETMALFVGLGWGSAAQTFVGQNLGADKLLRAKSSGWYAAAFNALMMAGLWLLYTRFGELIIGMFDTNPSVVNVALDYLRWVSQSYIALGIGIVLGSAIQGAGATRKALWLDGSVVLLFQMPISLLAVLAPGASTVRLFQAVALTYLAFALVHVASYWRGRFLHNSTLHVNA
ncbi:MAG TPA: MATE family efflux transporter [Polyangiaceae bacterium]|nr:MATE family efflux transporter [Polyangiaceae bacterium]